MSGFGLGLELGSCNRLTGTRLVGQQERGARARVRVRFAVWVLVRVRFRFRRGGTSYDFTLQLHIRVGQIAIFSYCQP